MVWMRRLFAALAVALVAAPAMAQGPQLNNSEVPGSVLVFPKFIAGSVQVGTADPVPPATARTPIREPKSAFEISVTCPVNGPRCAENARVKLLARWVCPASQTLSEKFVCKATDFELLTTVKGTVWINPENIGSRSRSVDVPRPPCNAGFLLVWVVSPDDANDPRAIKFDGLVGTAVLRNGTGSASGYTAYPIQAIDQLPPGALTDVNDDGRLQFDGLTEYKAITGQLRGTVRLERSTLSPTNTLGRIQTHVTMLTLDTLANRPNYPTFVDLHFFNENETLLSASHEFVCWTQVRLSDIDTNLDEFFGKKSLLETTQAEKQPIFGIADTAGDVTLLGLVETGELNRNTDKPIREYSYPLFNDGLPVPTTFAP
jgi:hypothetical protein